MLAVVIGSGYWHKVLRLNNQDILIHNPLIKRTNSTTNGFGLRLSARI